MNTRNKLARNAGFWYLIMAVTGPIGLLIVPSQMIEEGNAAATAQNILDSEFLFRIGLASHMVCHLAFIALVLALYRLYKDVNKTHAQLMVSLVLVSIPISFINLLNPLAALLFVKDTHLVAAFSLEERQSFAMTFLKFEEYGSMIAAIFWGLWLFPFGWLTYKSGFMPRILGILLIIGGACYMLDITAFFLFPDAEPTIAAIVGLPQSAGELSMVAWLLIKGVKHQPQPRLIDSLSIAA